MNQTTASNRPLYSVGEKIQGTHLIVKEHCATSHGGRTVPGYRLLCDCGNLVVLERYKFYGEKKQKYCSASCPVYLDFMRLNAQTNPGLHNIANKAKGGRARALRAVALPPPPVPPPAEADKKSAPPRSQPKAAPLSAVPSRLEITLPPQWSGETVIDGILIKRHP